MREHMIAIALLLTVPVVAAEPSLTDFKLADQSIHDLSNVLHVRAYDGQFTVDKPFGTVELIIAFFKDGKRLPLPTRLVLDRDVLGPVTEGHVSIQYIDLDYLTIRGAPDNCIRIHFAISTGLMRASAHTDISKDVFDIRKGHFSSRLIKGNDKIKNTLFYEGRTSSSNMHGAGSLDDLFKLNSGADIMVAYLSFTNRKHVDKPAVEETR